MRVAARFTLLVISLGALTGEVTAQQRAATADSVLALVAAYDRAWLSRDTTAVGRALAPEYQYFTSRGAIESRADALAILRAPEYVLDQGARSELGVRIAGPVAVVSSRWRGQGSFRGTKFTDDQRCGQVWLRNDPGWRVLSEHCVDIVRDSPPAN
jgi:ketosteroid isomerase-like protein